MNLHLGNNDQAGLLRLTPKANYHTSVCLTLAIMAASQVQKRDVIIAIDFGTTYSGFGYVFPNASEDHVYVFQKWGRGQGMSCRSKTPTALLLKENGELIKFGHAAVEIYAKQAISKKDCKRLLYFDKFKLLLHSKKVGSVYDFLKMN